MPDPTLEYLDRKGAIELLCEVKPGGSRFSELDDALPVSHQTLSRRLEEGRDASLLERKAISGHRGTTHTHLLTPRGAKLRLWWEERGLTASYQLYKKARQQFLDEAAAMRDELEGDDDDTTPLVADEPTTPFEVEFHRGFGTNQDSSG